MMRSFIGSNAKEALRRRSAGPKYFPSIDSRRGTAAGGGDGGLSNPRARSDRGFSSTAATFPASFIGSFFVSVLSTIASSGSGGGGDKERYDEIGRATV